MISKDLKTFFVLLLLHSNPIKSGTIWNSENSGFQSIAGRSILELAVMSFKVVDNCKFIGITLTKYGCYCGITNEPPQKGMVSRAKLITFTNFLRFHL